MITTSTPARWQASSARAWASEKPPSASRKSEAAAAEQGPVEVGVDAAQCHRSGRYGSDDELAAGRPDPRPGAAAGGGDRQRHRRLDVRGGAQRHAGAGGRRRAGAGRGRLRHARRRRGGGAKRAAGARPRTRRRRWCRRSTGLAGSAGGVVPISADTFSVEVARRALAAGARAVNDISGGSEEMFELVAESGCGYVLMHIEGPPRVDRPWRRVRRRGRPPARPGSRGESSWPGSLGSRRSRSPSTPDSTSTSAPSRTWRSCGGSASCARSACRSTSRSRARTSSAPCWPGPGRSGCRPGEREWGTVAAVALAVREGADVLRIHDRSSLQAMRVAAGSQRPRSAESLGLMARGGSLLETAVGGRDRPGAARRADRRRERRGGAPRAAGRAAGRARPGLRRGAAARPASSRLYSHQLRGLRGGRRTRTW